MSPDATLDRLPHFTGKVVLVYYVGSRDPHMSSAVVEPHFELQGGPVFMCGTPAPGDSPNDWIVGCRICVAWDTVETYLVFESVDDYTARAERGRAKTKVQ